MQVRGTASETADPLGGSGVLGAGKAKEQKVGAEPSAPPRADPSRGDREGGSDWRHRVRGRFIARPLYASAGQSLSEGSGITPMDDRCISP